MEILSFIATNWYAYLFIPFLIFLARVIDVSIGTVKMIFIAKGFKRYAPVLGFFEVLIWLLAIQQIFNNLNNIMCYLAYAGGFAAGTFVGIIIEEKLSVGKVTLRVITGKDAKPLFEELKEAKYTVINIGADGPDGKVKLIITVLKRQDVEKVIHIIRKHNPNAFYSVEDVRYAKEDMIIEVNKKRNMFGFFKKSK